MHCNVNTPVIDDYLYLYQSTDIVCHLEITVPSYIDFVAIHPVFVKCLVFFLILILIYTHRLASTTRSLSAIVYRAMR